MAIAIPLTSTTTNYTDAGAAVFDFGGTPYSSGYLYVQNAGAYISLKTANAQGSATWGAEFPTNTALIPLAGGAPSLARPNGPDRIYGVRARSLVAGTPAVIYGGVFQEGEAAVLPSNQVAGTISTSGTITPPSTSALNGLTGAVSAAGAILSGSGFTVAHPATGKYVVTATSPLGAAPIVVATANSQYCVIQTVGAITTTTFTIWTIDGSTANLTDFPWNFLAVVPQ